MNRKLLAFGLLLLIALSGFKTSRTTTYFIPTLHSLHKTNKNYNYESLKQLLHRLKPDVIAVEIRQEDIGQDSAYLRGNYPYEMRMMRYWFPEAKIEGFDWLGSDIEGKLIPDNYWIEISPIKKYQQELRADTVFNKKCLPCQEFAIQRLQLMQNLGLQELLNSQDALLTKKYYTCLAQNLNGTIHERILKFYDLRNERLLANINKVLKRNQGKTIVILTGDDHYVYLKDKITHKELYK